MQLRVRRLPSAARLCSKERGHPNCARAATFACRIESARRSSSLCWRSRVRVPPPPVVPVDAPIADPPKPPLAGPTAKDKEPVPTPAVPVTAADRSRLEAAEKNGAAVYEAQNGGYEVRIEGGSNAPNILAGLRGTKCVTGLSLEGDTVSDEALKHLDGFDHLERLTLARCLTLGLSTTGSTATGGSGSSTTASIVFSNNVRTNWLPLSIIPNSTNTADKSLVLNITSAPGYQIDPSNGTATVTIAATASPPGRSSAVFRAAPARTAPPRSCRRRPAPPDRSCGSRPPSGPSAARSPHGRPGSDRRLPAWRRSPGRTPPARRRISRCHTPA